ncbi:unnamed protein product [Musa banksii]
MWKGANGDGMTKSDCFRWKASGSRGGEGERSAAECSVASWLRLDAISNTALLELIITIIFIQNSHR